MYQQILDEVFYTMLFFELLFKIGIEAVFTLTISLLLLRQVVVEDDFVEHVCPPGVLRGISVVYDVCVAASLNTLKWSFLSENLCIGKQVIFLLFLVERQI